MDTKSVERREHASSSLCIFIVWGEKRENMSRNINERKEFKLVRWKMLEKRNMTSKIS